MLSYNAIKGAGFMKNEGIIIDSERQKKVTREEYLAANQKLARILNEKKLDYFDYLNLSSTTNLENLKWGLINKLSIALHDNLSLALLNDINDIIKAYKTLENPVTAKDYISELEKNNQKIIAALEEFMNIRIAYANSGRHNNVNIGPCAYISQNYVDWLIRRYQNTTYKIDYNVDFTPNENANFISILGDIKELLRTKYQNYRDGHGDNTILEEKYKSTARKLTIN